MSRSVRLIVLAIFVCSFGLTACKREKPTVTPKIQINKKSAEMATPVEVTYSFSTNSDYIALYKDMTVFVHFIDPKRVRRFQDDHVPPKPTSDWRPNGNYNYTRTVFIPKNIPAGEYTLVAGIYSPSKGERMVLEGNEFGNRSYDMGSLLIEIPPQEPVIQYAQGWHDLENSPGDVGNTWRWTGKEAILRVRNPNSDALLYLRYDGVPERFEGDPQKLTILVGDHVVDTITVDSNLPEMKKYTVDQEAVGTDKFTDVKLQVDKTFMPSQDQNSKDSRELGVRVYQIYLGKASD